jgi:CysZ protein
MQDVFNALGAALKTLFHPRMLTLIIWPMLVALVLWGGTATFFWTDWVHGLTHWLSKTPAESYLMKSDWSWVASYAITFILVMLLVPLVFVTALVITAIFAMPIMVNHVAKRNYPELEMKHGGTIMGSVWNGMVAVFVYCLLWVVTLPLWLFTPVAIVLPVFLFGYLNQRLFRYDALADHASADEFRQILERSTGRLYVLGTVLGLVQFVPILNFFAPVYIGLAFIHLCLEQLKRTRATG